MLSYDKLFSRVLNKINDPKELSLDESDLLEIYTERLHSVIGKPRVRRLFSSVKMDDEIMEMTFTLKDSVDEDSDKYFIIEVLSRGMVIAWLEPQVKSTANLAQMFGGKEQKWFSQAQHLTELKDLLSTAKSEQRRIICDHGYINNSYVRGE